MASTLKVVWAQAVRDLLSNIDLEKEAKELRAIIANEDAQKQKREKVG